MFLLHVFWDYWVKRWDSRQIFFQSLMKASIADPRRGRVHNLVLHRRSHSRSKVSPEFFLKSKLSMIKNPSLFQLIAAARVLKYLPIESSAVFLKDRHTNFHNFHCTWVLQEFTWATSGLRELGETIIFQDGTHWITVKREQSQLWFEWNLRLVSTTWTWPTIFMIRNQIEDVGTIGTCTLRSS